MPWMKWLPWRFLVGRAARAHGFLDPIALVARLHQFAQPSEVAVPLELLRAAVVFHARGLVNSRVIQHNLDWVWPYWIERQFNPTDPAFIPRAFSISHVNLTHRNWTAVGLPDVAELPIVDPRGLLTPLLDGWSVDCWIVTEDGRCLLPSRVPAVSQRLELDGLAVTTESAHDGLALTCRAGCEPGEGASTCFLDVSARADAPAWAVIALRPYNAEGISFIQKVGLSADRRGWRIDDRHRVTFSARADRHHVSSYKSGDVYIRLRERAEETEGGCDVGMTTAAAMFALQPGQTRELRIELPLPKGGEPKSWPDSLRGHCRLDIPEPRLRTLYDIALRTLVLHSPGDVYPGPYTYKRFWFRDAAFIVHALLCAGLISRAERALDRFPPRQDARGYFHSQEGEWDANGEALWIMGRFCALTGQRPRAEWLDSIRQAARWIGDKRVREPGLPHSGLLPAGFSAEHLGPNDYYYWDDFWGIAGLRAAADMLKPIDRASAAGFAREADAFEADVVASLRAAEQRLGRPAMPASPYRRLDAGAIGSIAAGYPLQLWPANDPRLLDTVEYLMANCFVDGGFFQDMVHSGINAYLTLQVAQILLRAHDPRYLDLMRHIGALASPTGQWPEAIHPRTLGGCMGDGQHVWAAAEWVVMLRNCFVREEGGRLVLCAGLPRAWLHAGQRLAFGPAPTAFGTVSLTVEADETELLLRWEGDWHAAPPPIDICLPGRAPLPCLPGQRCLRLPLEGPP
jgi:hypothetical protein